MRHVVAAAAPLLLLLGSPAAAQGERAEAKPPPPDRRLYELVCLQDATKLLTEHFVGPPKIELYGNFIVFSGPIPNGHPAVVIASEGAVCTYEEKH